MPYEIQNETTMINNTSNKQLLSVTKIDAGIAVLLTESMQIVEMPTFLLPNDITSGSFITLHMERHSEAENSKHRLFQSLQNEIMNHYGQFPQPPTLSIVEDQIVFNVTSISGHDINHIEWYWNDELIQIPSEETFLYDWYEKGLKESFLKLSQLHPFINSTQDSGNIIQLCLKTSSGPIWSNKLAVN